MTDRVPRPRNRSAGAATAVSSFLALGLVLTAAATPAQGPRGQLTREEGHASRAGLVAFFPDGRLLASGWHDGAVQIWDVAAPDRSLR